jgi:hypothetical protein
MQQSRLQCGFAIVAGRRESPRFAAACDPGATRGSGASQLKRRDPRTAECGLAGQARLTDAP